LLLVELADIGVKLRERARVIGPDVASRDGPATDGSGIKIGGLRTAGGVGLVSCDPCGVGGMRLRTGGTAVAASSVLADSVPAGCMAVAAAVLGIEGTATAVVAEIGGGVAIPGLVKEDGSWTGSGAGAGIGGEIDGTCNVCGAGEKTESCGGRVHLESVPVSVGTSMFMLKSSPL